MADKKRALFIGRFQPFHNGHLRVVKEALEEFDELVIAIGSAQYFNTKGNPFSADEREEMIKEALEKENIKNAFIAKIDDINCNGTYVSHVEREIPKCAAIFCGSEKTKTLFSKAGYDVRELGRYYDINATGIREKIIKGESWEELVPKKIAEYIKKIKGVERVKKICGASK